MTIGRGNGNFCHGELKINMYLMNWGGKNYMNRNINIAHATIATPLAVCKNCS